MNYIDPSKLESQQAYSSHIHNNLRKGESRCPECGVIDLISEDTGMCSICWKSYKEYQCSDCVKCEHIFPMEQMSDDSLCLDCWLEENPIK